MSAVTRMRKLNLNRDRIDQCIETAAHIVSHAKKFIDRHSTTSVEKATLYCLGLTGAWKGRLLADWIVSKLTKDQLRLGAAYWWGLALIHNRGEPQPVAELFARDRLRFDKLPTENFPQVRRKVEALLADSCLHRKAQNIPDSHGLRLAIGSSFDGIRRAISLGRDVPEASHLFVWPTTKEALQPHLAAASKESWDIRYAEVAKALPQKIFIPSSLGFHTPEIVAQLIHAGASHIQLDGFANIFSYQIHPQKSFVDTYFALGLGHFARRRLETAGYLWLKGRCRTSAELLSYLLLMEQFYVSAGFDLDAASFSFSWIDEPHKKWMGHFALAQVCREIFHQGHLMLANPEQAEWLLLIGMLTHQDGCFFEATHGKILKEIAQKKDLYQGLESELTFNLYGKVAREAHSILDATWKHLKKLEHQTFWNFLAEGGEASLGQEEIFQTDRHYFNPVRELLWQESASS